MLIMDEGKFEKYMEKHEEEISEAAAFVCMDIEQFKENLRVLARFFLDNVIRTWNSIKEFITVLDFEKIERERKQRRLLYKLNLDRPLIQNQVIDRKPQHLIKKIIY